VQIVSPIKASILVHSHTNHSFHPFYQKNSKNAQSLVPQSPPLNRQPVENVKNGAFVTQDSPASVSISNSSNTFLDKAQNCGAQNNISSDINLRNHMHDTALSHQSLLTRSANNIACEIPPLDDRLPDSASENYSNLVASEHLPEDFKSKSSAINADIRGTNMISTLNLSNRLSCTIQSIPSPLESVKHSQAHISTSLTLSNSPSNISFTDIQKSPTNFAKSKLFNPSSSPVSFELKACSSLENKPVGHEKDSPTKLSEDSSSSKIKSLSPSSDKSDNRLTFASLPPRAPFKRSIGQRKPEQRASASPVNSPYSMYSSWHEAFEVENETFKQSDYETLQRLEHNRQLEEERTANSSEAQRIQEALNSLSKSNLSDSPAELFKIVATEAFAKKTTPPPVSSDNEITSSPFIMHPISNIPVQSPKKDTAQLPRKDDLRYFNKRRPSGELQAESEKRAKNEVQERQAMDGILSMNNKPTRASVISKKIVKESLQSHINQARIAIRVPMASQRPKEIVSSGRSTLAPSIHECINIGETKPHIEEVGDRKGKPKLTKNKACNSTKTNTATGPTKLKVSFGKQLQF
jgi:hypothetical protein